ncbi:MAG: hypothetical protein MUE42_04110 [Opitutaceae bacterium]|jgi:hypothetical protein|nr:hypothetical protein [Opitutaceae bacterium]
MPTTAESSPHIDSSKGKPSRQLVAAELSESFARPSAAYRGKPFWSWNGRLDRAELLRQLEVVRGMGMGGAFMHARTGLETEYLGPEWFDLINACADRAQEMGLESWLYDEDRWPSGSAGGLATADPSLRMRYLRLARPSIETFSWPADDALVAVFAAKVDGLHLGAYRRLERGAGAPDLYAGESLLVFTWEVMPEHSFYNGASYLNTMNAAATQRFIEVTHERYLAACGKRLGTSITGIFTDEPHRGFVMCDTHGQTGPDAPSWITPWTTALPSAYAERFGEDLVARLPELFLRKDGASVSPVKWRYMELIQTLFLENWAKPLHAWCRAHNLKLTGHALHEDSLGAQAVPCGSLMRYYEHMDVPGIDLLFLGNNRYWIVKQVASVARQQGHKWLLSELYGCTGWQLDFAGHKEIGDWQAFLGINVRCHHLSWVTMAGEAKRDYPASIFFQSSWYSEYKAVEDYYARLHVMLQRGEAVCDLLVVNPVESLWAQIHGGWATWLTTKAADLLPLEEQFADTCRWLSGTTVDFDYGDEDHLARFGGVEPAPCQSDSPRLRVGQARYRAVLVSGATTLRGTTLNLLQSFRDAGGIVILAGMAPAYLDAQNSSAPADFFRRCRSVPFERAALQREVSSLLSGLLQIDEPEEAQNQIPLITRFRRDGDTWIIALHHPAKDAARQPFTVRFGLKGLQVQEWDARTGRRYEQPVQAHEDGIAWTVALPPLGEKLYVLTPHADSTLPLRAEPRERERATARGPFAYELDEPNALVLDQAEWALGDDLWQPSAEILRIDEIVRERLGLPGRSGMMVQPWARAPRATPGATAPLRLRHRIHVRGQAPTDAVLLLEKPAIWRATLNGRAVDLSRDLDWFIDPCMRRIALPTDSLHAGENVLELATAFHEGVDLEAVYLLGSFGVFFEGVQPVVDALPATLAVGDVVPQGLPFYSGRIRYQLPLPLRAPDGRLHVELPKFGGAVAVVRDESGARSEILAFPPYSADLGTLSGADARVTCEIVLTRRNLFGPLHLAPKEQNFIGPDSFRSRGEAWSDGYQLFPAGLLDAPVFIHST